MDVRPSGSAIETKESHCWKVQLPMEVTPLGTTACPSASGVYKQRAATPPSASRAKINIASMGPGEPQRRRRSYLFRRLLVSAVTCFGGYLFRRFLVSAVTFSALTCFGAYFFTKHAGPCFLHVHKRERLSLISYHVHDANLRQVPGPFWSFRGIGVFNKGDSTRTGVDTSLQSLPAS